MDLINDNTIKIKADIVTNDQLSCILKNLMMI